jgi:small subunit ribosomal protein S16
MVRLRMQKVGRPLHPHFRIVAIPGTKARDAASLEVLGHYHPKQKSNRVTVDMERVTYWIGKGAQPSDTLRTALTRAGLWSASPAPAAA